MEIPFYITEILKKLESAGFEAFIVGGCVRDLLMEKEPKDWDITTNARPEQTLAVFPDGKYENDFGTVLVPIRDENNVVLAVVEITTYRSEQGYSDRRHPDQVVFEDSLEKDLMRRDFTVNAMAGQIPPSSAKATAGEEYKIQDTKDETIVGVRDLKIVDLFGGQKDLRAKIIRAVGEPSDRFREDALRMMRAIRFACQLGFSIEDKTQRAIVKLAGSIKFVANERIKDELVKILASDRFYEGIMLLHETKLLQYILPELEQGIGMGQKGHHIYTVFEHSVLTLKYCPNPEWQVRLAALLHDIGKPRTRNIINGETTFYNHEYVGAKIAGRIMERLKFSREDSDRVINLIRNHMFYYNVGEVTESSVRRLIAKAGEENLKDLIDIRIADRLGSGVAKAKPYKLRHLEYLFDKVRHDPVSVKMLKINGDRLMELLDIAPGPKIGAILDVLLSDVLDDPALNTAEYLEMRSLELAKLELSDLREQAKEKIIEKREEDNRAIKKIHKV